LRATSSGVPRANSKIATTPTSGVKVVMLSSGNPVIVGYPAARA
jgi:hypothetical protein